MVQVMDSFETSISIDKKIEKTETFTITDSGVITLDNKGCELNYPKLSITGSATLSGAFLMQNGNQFSLTNGMTLSTDDELILDFNKQDYKLNGEIINNFSIDDLINLPANDEAEISVSCTGELDIGVSYPSYEIGEDLHYVEDWDLTTRYTHTTNKPFNSTRVRDSRVEGVRYNFTVTKMVTNFELYNSIENGDEYRITYTEYNPDTYEHETKHLIGVRFNQFKRSFQMGEFILANISGEFNQIITKK